MPDPRCFNQIYFHYVLINNHTTNDGDGFVTECVLEGIIQEYRGANRGCDCWLETKGDGLKSKRFRCWPHRSSQGIDHLFSCFLLVQCKNIIIIKSSSNVVNNKVCRARAINTDYTVNENYIETVLHTR